MTDDKIKQIINETVTTTVLQLRAAGLLKDETKSAYEKTEALLYQYTELRKVDEPYARRVCEEIDACLEDAANDPFIDAIRLFYFGGNKNAACAAIMCYDERTLRRNRRRLVEQFSVRLASDDFIRELLL